MRAPAFHAGRAGLALLLVSAVAACGENEAPDDVIDPIMAPEIARIVPAEEAIAGTRLATLDPATMNDAELRKTVGTGPHCEFRYTTSGRPVLAAGMLPDEPPGDGVVKVNGSLVTLDPVASEAAAEADGTISLAAGPIRIVVAPDPQAWEQRDGALRREANMIFRVGQSLRVGYRGYWDCTSEPPIVSSH